MITAASLAKSFGRVAALRGLDFEVADGETVAVLGANGAGKTTLLRILATLDKPSKGELRIAGFDAVRERHKVRRLIGVVGHQTYLHPELSVAEELRFYARLYGVAVKRVPLLLEQVVLETKASTRVAALSRGQQQRLAIARALLPDPQVLLLDEPDTGLDGEGMAFLEGLLRSRRTVVFSTHNHGWAYALAARALELNEGRIASG